MAADVGNDPKLQAMTAMLPPQLLSQFKAMTSITNGRGLVPCLWLKDKMRLLCVRKELAEKTAFILERHAVHSGPDMQ
jgi:hypothetical protein